MITVKLRPLTDKETDATWPSWPSLVPGERVRIGLTGGVVTEIVDDSLPANNKTKYGRGAPFDDVL